jgi:NADH dehydrogenase
LAEIAHDTLKGDFRAIHPADAQIVLLEAGARVLPAFAPDLSAKAEHVLHRLGVTVRLGTAVTDVDADGVRLQAGAHAEHLAARTVLWAAGVQASPLAAMLVEATGAAADRAGRVIVGPDLTVPGHAEIFVLGDMAHAERDGVLLPGLAPVAMAEGRYAAKAIAARARGATPPPFRFRDKGTMATIGRAAAVADLGFVRFNGLLAWLAWVFIHVMYLVGFENRVLVLFQWVWSYVTRNRGARLITGPDPLPLPLSDAGQETTQRHDDTTP